MSLQHLASAIAAVRGEFDVTLADTPGLRREAFRLRHQVYCLERGFEPVTGDTETDEFDESARHVLLRHRPSGEALGTVRVILDRPGGFPMERVCPPGVLNGVPRRRAAEVSRFAISKDRRQTTGAVAALMRLGLMQGVIRVSRDEGLTHLCALMERSLLRLLQSTCVRFQPTGPMIEHRGLRCPVVCNIGATLEWMRAEQPAVWGFVTGDGTLWEGPRQVVAA